MKQVFTFCSTCRNKILLEIFSTTCPVGQGVNVNTGLPEDPPHLLLRIFADDLGAEEARDIVPLYSVIVPFFGDVDDEHKTEAAHLLLITARQASS